MKALEKIASRAVNGITVRVQYGWPPVCSGTFHQPERPAFEDQDENSSEGDVE